MYNTTSANCFNHMCGYYSIETNHNCLQNIGSCQMFIGTHRDVPKNDSQSDNYYEKLSIKVGKLVDEKQAAYGNSFGKSGEFLKLLYPEGIQPDQYNNALTLVRIFDKQMRIATDKDAFGESPYQDIAGYGLLGMGKDNINTKPSED